MLQHAATTCDMMQREVAKSSLLCISCKIIITVYLLLQHAARYYNTLQQTVTRCNTLQREVTQPSLLCISCCNAPQRTATHCNTLQHTVTHCNTLHHAAPHCNTQQHTATHSSTLQHTAAHCNTLQHTATHCSTLQHNAMEVARQSFLGTYCTNFWRTSQMYSDKLFVVYIYDFFVYIYLSICYAFLSPLAELLFTHNRPFLGPISST